MKTAPNWIGSNRIETKRIPCKLLQNKRSRERNFFLLCFTIGKILGNFPTLFIVIRSIMMLKTTERTKYHCSIEMEMEKNECRKKSIINKRQPQIRPKPCNSHF